MFMALHQVLSGSWLWSKLREVAAALPTGSQGHPDVGASAAALGLGLGFGLGLGLTLTLTLTLGFTS